MKQKYLTSQKYLKLRNNARLDIGNLKRRRDW
jgi:hypothetical protein